MVWNINKNVNIITDKLKLVADFETTTRDGKEVVWLFDICKLVDYSHLTGESLEEFISIIDEVEVGCDIYFHNLKFDGSFIINFLLEKGFKLQQNDNIKHLKKRELSTLITDMGQFFKITIKNSKNKFINFVDSLKVIPFAADKIAKDFDLSCRKGEIDYNKERPEGYVATEKEIDYVRTDTQIIAEALNHMFGLGHTSLTLSSCAFKDYKQMCGTGDWDKWFGEWETKCNLELDQAIRKAYRGGFCFANPDYVNKSIKQPTFYNDVNSLYPYVMSNFAMPYGAPVEFEGEYKKDQEHPYYIQKISVDMSVKEGGIPCIINTNIQKGNSRYIVDTMEQSFSGGGVIDLTVTGQDMDLIYKNYNIHHIEYKGGWKFKVNNTMFTKYVQKYYKMKKEADKSGNRVKRTIAKLFLNSLYGKFGQNPKRAKKYPKLGEDGKIRLKYDIECEENEPIYRISKNFNYLPVAIFVTAIARWKIVNDILKIGVENWVYTDTDSIVTLVPLPKLMVDDVKLGKYKIEHVMKRFKTLGQKTYYGIDIKGKKVIAIAGCSKKALEKLPYGKFEYFDKKSKRRKGVITNGRTCLRTVPGGKKLEFGDFCLRDKRDLWLWEALRQQEGINFAAIDAELYKFLKKFDNNVDLDVDT